MEKKNKVATGRKGGGSDSGEPTDAINDTNREGCIVKKGGGELKNRFWWGLFIGFLFWLVYREQTLVALKKILVIIH